MTETRTTINYRPWLYGGGLTALALATTAPFVELREDPRSGKLGGGLPLIELHSPTVERFTGKLGESLNTLTNLQAWTDLFQYRNIQKLQTQNDKQGYELARKQERETHEHANKVNHELSEWMKSESVIKFLNEELNLDASKAYPREFLLRCWHLHDLIVELQKNPFKLAEVVKTEEAKFFPHFKNFDPNKPEELLKDLTLELKAAKPEERKDIITRFITGEMEHAVGLVKREIR